MVQDVLRSTGRRLDAATRADMESHFGHDFSAVQVHDDARAAASARAIDARAYTVGQHIAFDTGKYCPAAPEGRRLLAHELTHTLQQPGGMPPTSSDYTLSRPSDHGEREAIRFADDIARDPSTGPPMIKSQMPPVSRSETAVQRDLVAYSSEGSELLPSLSAFAPVTYYVYTADAPRVQAALQHLLSSGKVGLRTAGNRTYFFSTAAGLTEISAAFTAAGFPRATQMSRALVDPHNLSVYSHERLTKVSGLFTITMGNKKSELLQRATERVLTNFERHEARLVFGDNLNYDVITLAEDPLMSVGNYARALPRTIYFPPEAFSSHNFMPWLIHELMHSWQYQQGVSVWKTLIHAVEADYDYGGEAGLRSAIAAGRGLKSFNTEEQGDIASDYYQRLKSGEDVQAWLPFIAEIKGLSTPTARPAPTVIP